MSPIFVRPVREQLEHDRLVRSLQLKYKRKFDATMNAGDEQSAPVRIGPVMAFPDLVLHQGKKLAGLVEVETGESVNNLEAMAQWTHFGRARVPFHLYVPVQAYDVARRLCEANQVKVAEIWTFRSVADQFDLVRVFHDPSAVPRARPVAGPATGKGAKAPSRGARPAKRRSAAAPKKAARRSAARARPKAAKAKRK